MIVNLQRHARQVLLVHPLWIGPLSVDIPYTFGDAPVDINISMLVEIVGCGIRLADGAGKLFNMVELMFVLNSPLDVSAKPYDRMSAGRAKRLPVSLFNTYAVAMKIGSAMHAVVRIGEFPASGRIPYCVGTVGLSYPAVELLNGAAITK